MQWDQVVSGNYIYESILHQFDLSQGKTWVTGRVDPEWVGVGVGVGWPAG